MYRSQKLLALGFIAIALCTLAGCAGRSGLGALLTFGFLSLAQETGEADWEQNAEITYQETRGDSLYVELERDDGRRAFLTMTEDGDSVHVTGMAETQDGPREIDETLENLDVIGDEEIEAELDRTCWRGEGC